MLKRLAILTTLLAATPALAAVTDPAQTAADALVAQGCTIARTTARFIVVSCPGKPDVRIMRMPRA